MDPSWFSLEQTQCVLNDQVQLGHTVRRVWTTECHCPSWPCPNWSDKFGLNQELVYVQLRTCMTIQNAWWFVLCGNLHRRRKHDRVASLTWGANTSCGNAKCNHKRIMKDQFRCACVCVLFVHPSVVLQNCRIASAWKSLALDCKCPYISMLSRMELKMAFNK